MNDLWTRSIVAIIIIGWGLVALEYFAPRDTLLVPALTEDLYDYCYNSEDDNFIICRYRE